MSDSNSTLVDVDEQWQDLPGFKGYQASSRGNVRSCVQAGRGKGFYDNWRVLKPKVRAYNRGRRTVAIRSKDQYVGRLILLTFVGPCPPGHECCHKDDDPSNDALPNLYWGTHRQNAEDALRNGRIRRGNQKSTAKLTDEQVIEIRRRAKGGEQILVLAAEHGMSRPQMNSVVIGKVYGHLPGALPRKRARRTLTVDGQTMLATEWAKLWGINYRTVAAQTTKFGKEETVRRCLAKVASRLQSEVNPENSPTGLE